MSELSNYGPMDMVRDITDEATELDRLVRDCADTDSRAYSVLQQRIAELTEDHPLNDQEVVAYGNEVVCSGFIDDETTYPWMIGTGYNQPTDGVYYGLTIRPLYDVRDKREKHGVVHMLGTGSSYVDEFYNQHQTTTFTYMPVQGSELIPALPLNAHSLQEMQRDGIIHRFDELLLNDDSEVTERLRNLGALASKIFAKNSGRVDQNHQRVSYLNSLGLLDGLQLTVTDALVATRNDFCSGQAWERAGSAQFLAFEPDLFDIAPTYSRQAGAGSSYSVDKSPALYASAITEDGDRIFAKLDNVVAADTIAN
jgi:hypothetical protein